MYNLDTLLISRLMNIWNNENIAVGTSIAFGHLIFHKFLSTSLGSNRLKHGSFTWNILRLIRLVIQDHSCLLILLSVQETLGF